MGRRRCRLLLLGKGFGTVLSNRRITANSLKLLESVAFGGFYWTRRKKRIMIIINGSLARRGRR